MRTSSSSPNWRLCVIGVSDASSWRTALSSDCAKPSTTDWTCGPMSAESDISVTPDRK
jgi:hypothetical protein